MTYDQQDQATEHAAAGDADLTADRELTAESDALAEARRGQTYTGDLDLAHADHHSVADDFTAADGSAGAEGFITPRYCGTCDHHHVGECPQKATAYRSPALAPALMLDLNQALTGVGIEATFAIMLAVADGRGDLTLQSRGDRGDLVEEVGVLYVELAPAPAASFRYAVVPDGQPRSAAVWTEVVAARLVPGDPALIVY